MTIYFYKRVFLYSLFLFLNLAPIIAQNVTISGYVKDDKTGEELLGATIYDATSGLGAVTNMYGFYSLSIPVSEAKLVFTYMGYSPLEKTITVKESITLNTELSSKSEQLDEVEIVGSSSDRSVSSLDIGVEKLDMRQAAKIPVLFGEKDILKTIQLMPGISSAGEGSGGLNVRGGGMDENLILLDGAPVYNASHMMGFFSVFNSDALKGMTVYKGGIPAKYGGRASSVIDVQMNNGNMRKFSASGGIGLISSRLTLEGPIAKDKASFIVSGRRTYADIAFKTVSRDPLVDDASLFFYDLNAKVNWKINDKNRVYLSSYFGRDMFGYDFLGMEWGNQTFTARWNHLFSDKLFSNTSLIFSDYIYNFDMSLSGSDGNLSSGIKNMTFKEDLTWFVNSKNSIDFGASISDHTFYPGELNVVGEEDDDTNFQILMEEKYAYETGLYISNMQKITSRLKATYGLRFSMFSVVGPGDVKTYDEENIPTSVKTYGKGELIKNFSNWEPRLGLTYILNNNNSVKASYNRMAQYLHVLSTSTSGQPTDYWMPSGTHIDPLIVDQLSAGYFKNIDNGMFETSLELYYKKLTDVADYEDGANIFINEDVEAQVLMGKGRSYGAEFLFRKNQGALTGWVSYTLSRTEHQFDELGNIINKGNPFAASNDKTHDISIVASYELNKRISLNAAWVYATGSAVTYPAGQYTVDGRVVPYYTDRNADRMPNNHRLDIGVSLKTKPKEKYESSWDFGIYNLYGRRNAYSIDFIESEVVPGSLEAQRVALFTYVPSITWNFKF